MSWICVHLDLALHCWLRGISPEGTIRQKYGINQAISPLKMGLAARTGVEPVHQP